MIIGVPKERKQGEKRVGITPQGVKELKQLGHKVIIEKGAGENSSFIDLEYSNAGAEIAQNLQEVWNNSKLLVKVKEPAKEELDLFRKDHSVFCFFHAAAVPEITQQLLLKEVIALDYDLLQLDDGRLPILSPMSEVAGKLSVQIGANLLQSNGNFKGYGILLGGTKTVKPAKVVILGAGVSGTAAAEVAIGMGAEVVIVDINKEKLKKFEGRAKTLISSKEAISSECTNAHLLIGSVLVPGALAPKLITREMIKSMPNGSVFVDICIDQGGCSETSKPTSIADPIYLEEGTIHYCVTNMPALVPNTSTLALTNETLPWIKQIANLGVLESIKKHNELKLALITSNGKSRNDEISKALGLAYDPI